MNTIESFTVFNKQKTGLLDNGLVGHWANLADLKKSIY
jgi:hypothetical protein